MLPLPHVCPPSAPQSLPAQNNLIYQEHQQHSQAEEATSSRPSPGGGALRGGMVLFASGGLTKGVELPGLTLVIQVGCCSCCCKEHT